MADVFDGVVRAIPMLNRFRFRSQLAAMAVLAMAGLLLFTAPGTAAPKKAKVRPPLELRISGTSFFRYGEPLKFKAVVTNRSSAPIVIVPTYDLTWTILDSAGRELKQDACMICPITGIESGAKFPLKDDDVRLLQPGEKMEMEESNIGLCYSFAGRGSYQVVAGVVFDAPEFTENGDAIVKRMEFDKAVLLDLRSLSTTKREALKHAVALAASSNRWIIHLLN